MHLSRVLVLGPPGSGKSTFARQLGAHLGLPVVHLDTLFWKPGWVESPDDEFIAKVSKAVEQDVWVIDGNYTRAGLVERVHRADVVVFLDLPRRLCLYRIVKRHFMYRKRSRPDLTEGCPERFDSEFFREFIPFAWRWHGLSRERKLEMLAAHPRPDSVRIVRSRRDARRLLSSLAS